MMLPSRRLSGEHFVATAWLHVPANDRFVSTPVLLEEPGVQLPHNLYFFPSFCYKR